jgi:hypothetical protein
VRLEGEHLVCERCTTKFRIKDGLPVMIIDEAVLPEGCVSVDQLPCQREVRPAQKGG